MKEDIMVSVIIFTYNHEKYFRDAIEGVLKQKTDFKYEVIIHDDASTDHTQELIREYKEKYTEKIVPILQTENQFWRCHLSAEFVYPKIRGKYFAFCEGDDFWTDENKLQMQIDFLEAHEEYSMCMHNAVKWNCVTDEKTVLNTFPKDGTYSQEEQILAGLGTNFPSVDSYVLRTELLKNVPDFLYESNVMDYPIRQYYANKGKVYYFQKPMSVYRVSKAPSYMNRIREEEEFYNNYTLEMINFFEKFNDYTERKFDYILQNKIVSDYFGFCSSIAEHEGIEKALAKGLNSSKIKTCYRLLSPEYLDISIQKLCEKAKNMFIYGTSRMAEICKKQLIQAGIEFEGFAVSDGQVKSDMIGDKKVFYLSEIVENYDNPGFVLAVQPVNIQDIEKMLRKYGVEHYCKPYVIA